MVCSTKQTVGWQGNGCGPARGCTSEIAHLAGGGEHFAASNGNVYNVVAIVGWAAHKRFDGIERIGGNKWPAACCIENEDRSSRGHILQTCEGAELLVVDKAEKFYWAAQARE